MSGMSSINSGYTPQATELLGSYGLSTSGSGSSNTEQVLEEIENMVNSMLQQLQGGGSSDGSGSGAPSTGAPATGTPTTGTPTTGAPAAGAPATGTPTPGVLAASTPTTGASTGSPAMNPQSASGALAGYMGTNGNQSIDVNDLYKLSQGQAAGGNGQTPSPEVQQAAQYMMSNPSVYNQIETHDVAGADGESSATNFQNAAQGNIPAAAPTGSGTTPALPTPALPTATGTPAPPPMPTTTSTPAATATPTTTTGASTTPSGMNEQSASGALGGYMGTNGNSALNVNDLYKLSLGQAAGGNGQTPSPEVRQAAQYMMSNPSVFNKIETHDVAGTDGNSGAPNFQNAAQGLV